MVVIIPARVVSSKNKNKNQNDEDNRRPNYGDIVDFIIGNQITAQMDINDAGSAQAQAILWLTRDDPANLPVPTSASIDTYEGYIYMVRYVMAVNYFALGGVNWDSNLQFLTQGDVCSWNGDLNKEGSLYRMGLFCAYLPSEAEGGLIYIPYMLYIGTFSVLVSFNVFKNYTMFYC
jgi:hypothetical protein